MKKRGLKSTLALLLALVLLAAMPAAMAEEQWGDNEWNEVIPELLNGEEGVDLGDVTEGDGLQQAPPPAAEVSTSEDAAAAVGEGAAEVEEAAEDAPKAVAAPEGQIAPGASPTTIVFDPNGGTPVPSNQSVELDAHLTKPGDPQKAGCAFMGWTCTDDDGKAHLWDFAADTPASVWKTYAASHTLTARWGYAITWVDGDGKTLKTENVAVDETPAYSGDAPTKAKTAEYSYTFNSKWSPEIVKVSGTATYTAQFDQKPNPYTITFDVDGGVAIDPITADYGAAVTAPADPIRAGYSFTGWDKAIPATMPAENLTIKALWAESPTPASGGYAVTIGSLKASGKNGFKFSWIKVPDAGGYDVFFGPYDGSGKAPLYKTIQWQTRYCRMTELTADTLYQAYALAWTMKNGVKTYIAATPLACAYIGSGTATVANPKSVSAKPTKLTLLQGNQDKLTVTVKGLKGKATLDNPGLVRYYSDNVKVATVGADGTVTAVGAGACKVYAIAANGANKVVKVTVLNGPTKVKFKKSTYKLAVGQTLTLADKMKFTPATVPAKSYTWASQNPDIATVDANGVVTAVKRGKAVITVTTNNGKVAKVKIKVK